MSITHAVIIAQNPPFVKGDFLFFSEFFREGLDKRCAILQNKGNKT